MWIAFHYFRNKDSIPSQCLFPIFYLKFSSKELTKENDNEKFPTPKRVIAIFEPWSEIKNHLQVALNFIN